jgi:hypothetical protein
MENYIEVLESLLEKYDHIKLRIGDGGECFFKDGQYYRLFFEREPLKNNQLYCAIIPFGKNGRAKQRSPKYIINNEEDIINIVKSVLLTDADGCLILKKCYEKK